MTSCILIQPGNLGNLLFHYVLAQGIADSSAEPPRRRNPFDFDRLITAASGLDGGVNGTPRASDFNPLLPSAITAPAPSPTDFAQRNRIRRRFETLPHQRYDPGFSRGTDSTRLDFTDDPFFASWTLECDVQGHCYEMSAPGVPAMWSLEA